MARHRLDDDRRRVARRVRPAADDRHSRRQGSGQRRQAASGRDHRHRRPAGRTFDADRRRRQLRIPLHAAGDLQGQGRDGRLLAGPLQQGRPHDRADHAAPRQAEPGEDRGSDGHQRDPADRREALRSPQQLQDRPGHQHHADRPQLRRRGRLRAGRRRRRRHGPGQLLDRRFVRPRELLHHRRREHHRLRLRRRRDVLAELRLPGHGHHLRLPRRSPGEDRRVRSRIRPGARRRDQRHRPLRHQRREGTRGRLRRAAQPRLAGEDGFPDPRHDQRPGRAPDDGHRPPGRRSVHQGPRLLVRRLQPGQELERRDREDRRPAQSAAPRRSDDRLDLP